MVILRNIERGNAFLACFVGVLIVLVVLGIVIICVHIGHGVGVELLLNVRLVRSGVLGQVVPHKLDKVFNLHVLAQLCAVGFIGGVFVAHVGNGFFKYKLVHPFVHVHAFVRFGFLFGYVAVIGIEPVYLFGNAAFKLRLLLIGKVGVAQLARLGLYNLVLNHKVDKVVLKLLKRGLIAYHVVTIVGKILNVHIEHGLNIAERKHGFAVYFGYRGSQVKLRAVVGIRGLCGGCGRGGVRGLSGAAGGIGVAQLAGAQYACGHSGAQQQGNKLLGIQIVFSFHIMCSNGCASQYYVL